MNEENNGTAYSRGPPKKKGKKEESEDSSDDEPLGANARAERAKLKKDSESESEDESSDDDDDDDEDEDWMDEISVEDPNNPDELLVQELMMKGDGGDDDEEEEEEDGRGSSKERQRKSDFAIQQMNSGTMSKTQAKKCAAGVVSHSNLHKVMINSKARGKGFGKLSAKDADVMKHGNNDTLGLSFEMRLSKAEFIVSKILKKKRAKNGMGGFRTWDGTLINSLNKIGYKIIVPGVNCVESGGSDSELPKSNGWKSKMEGNKVKFIMTKKVHYLKKEDLK